MIRLACFDLDGTLVSSLPEIAAGVRELARRESLPEPSDAVVGNMIGGGVRVLIERLAAWWCGSGESPAIDEETLLKRLVAIWSAMDGGLIALIPGAFEGVRALRDAGVSTWLVTNKEESLARAFLERRGLTDAFDGILGAHARPGVRLKQPQRRARRPRGGRPGASCRDGLQRGRAPRPLGAGRRLHGGASGRRRGLREGASRDPR